MQYFWQGKHWIYVNIRYMVLANPIITWLLMFVIQTNIQIVYSTNRASPFVCRKERPSRHFDQNKETTRTYVRWPILEDSAADEVGAWVYVHECMCMSVCAWVYVRECVYVCLCVRVSVCAYGSVCAYACVCLSTQHCFSQG